MTLTTCLWFDGNAREAAEFYVSIIASVAACAPAAMMAMGKISLDELKSAYELAASK